MKKTKTPWFRKPRVERELGKANLTDAMAQVQPEPLRIHNPDRGTRSHDLDPDSGRPVCKASGTAWVTGDGGLRECGLCRDMRAGRLGDAEGQVAS